MSEQSHYSSRGHVPRGRGGGRVGFNRGGRGGRGRGRGGFQQQQASTPYKHVDVDYTPEAIEQRFSPFYLPSMTMNPWVKLEQHTK